MSINDDSVLARLRNARQKKGAKEEPKPEGEKGKAQKKCYPKKVGRSEKMRGIISALRPLYNAFLEEKEACEIGSPVCSGQPECVHHEEGRGIKVILDQSKWKASCGPCNSWVENKDADAREQGHKKSRHAKKS